MMNKKIKKGMKSERKKKRKRGMMKKKTKGGKAKSLNQIIFNYQYQILPL